MKKLRMLLTLMLVSVCSWQGAWAEDVVVSVILTQKNSLKNEITASSEPKYVTHLTVATVSGVQLGDEDWKTLRSMTALRVLDLSNASALEIPDNQFYEKCSNLVTVKLPKDLTTIGSLAFCNKEKLVTVIVPSTVTTIGDRAFYECTKLKKCDLSKCNISAIPSGCFDGCSLLQSFTIPSSVTDIGESAFYGCEQFTSPLPTGLKSIGGDAFWSAKMDNIDIVIPEGMDVESGTFSYTGISSIEFPTTHYKFKNCYDGCTNLNEIIMKSPTVVSDYVSVVDNASNNTLKVPSHLVASYKSDPNWSKYKEVIAISPAVESYTVSTDLNLSNSYMRMEGTPSVLFTKDASLTIVGNSAQAFNNFTANASSWNFTSTGNQYTMILNESADVTVNGDYTLRYVIEDGQEWYFLCMPFDFMVGDVTVNKGSFVIRTYDGKRRNTKNVDNGNWSTNATADVEIKAGTGFILQTSEEGDWDLDGNYIETMVTFKAKAGGNNYAFRKQSDNLQIPLNANNSNTKASAANTGWNMVGNPWQTYYNIHNMNYTAPFAVYDGSSYQTYSPDDDDYALSPFQAIFVQCPKGVSSIDFPANGRQLTSTVTTSNPSSGTRASQGRQLFDIQIAKGELKDKTRLIVNANALMDYEIGRDASKFFAEGTTTPQIYSLGADGTQYAFNERPVGNGTLQLGILFASDGEYTFSAIRNEIGQVILIDNETGIKTDLEQNSYTFEAKAGTSNTRFTLEFGGSATAIHTAMSSEVAEKEIYTLDGHKVGNSANGLKKGVYVVRQGQKTQKIIIK